MRPPVVPSTSSIQTPTAGTPQTPSIPLDTILKLFEALSPGLNLTHTLARLVAENNNPVLVQPPIVPIPKPTTEPPQSSPKPTEASPEKEAESEPETPTPASQLPPKPKSPTPEQPSEIPTQIPTETPTEILVDTHTQATNIIEVVDTKGDDSTPGSIGERGGKEEGMEVEAVVEAGDEKKEEEVDQVLEEEERDIVVLDDEDDTEVIDENKPEEGNDGRTTRRRTRFARRLAEILATGQDKQVESDPSDAEEKEEEEFPLKRRLRSSKATGLVDSTAKEAEEVHPGPTLSKDTPPVLEKEATTKVLKRKD